MYIWKVNKLTEDLKLGRVTSKEEFKYLLANTVAVVIITDPYLYIGTSYNNNDIINTISMLLISIIGLLYCYKVNTSGDNNDYIRRFICISIPIAIRILVFYIPIFILYSVLIYIYSANTNTSNFETDVYSVIITNTYLIAFYVYLSIKIKAVSHNEA